MASRIGKLPVKIEAGVTVTVTPELITVKGSKGELSVKNREELNIEVKDNEVIVTTKNDDKLSNSYHGLYRQLIENMIIGVSKGYSKALIVNGVGYRAEVKNNILFLNLGYSTNIEYMIPQGITITVEGPNKLVIAGCDKQQVGQVAAEIRSLRMPEPYKGKGIKYETENIRRKVGKSGK